MTVSNRPDQGISSSVITVKDTKCLAKLYEENPSYRHTDSSYEGRESFNKKIHVHIGDITEMAFDAIVCATQTNLLLKPIGIAKSVLGKGGIVLQELCREIGHIEVGEARITQGHELPCKYVIHTAGPASDTLLSYEQRKQCLRSSYLSCLNFVKQHNDIRSVVFPCLGVGGANIELHHAVQVATTTLREWLETPDNFNSVDTIVLCMYTDQQWAAYFQQLIIIFPYGKDLAGFDMEELPNINMSTLKAGQGNSGSTILCFQYKTSARAKIKKHFHTLANNCCVKLGTPTQCMDRYRNCTIIPVGGNDFYTLTLYHSDSSNTIEVQVLCKTSSMQYFDISLCTSTCRAISDYLEEHFENITCFSLMIRCPQSSWGQADGLWSVRDLQDTETSHTQIFCMHATRHSAHPLVWSELLRFWQDGLTERQQLFQSPSPQTQPENQARVPVENCWSLPSNSEGSGSMNKSASPWSLQHTNSQNASVSSELHAESDAKTAGSKPKSFFSKFLSAFGKSEPVPGSCQREHQTEKVNSISPTNDSAVSVTGLGGGHCSSDGFTRLDDSILHSNEQGKYESYADSNDVSLTCKKDICKHTSEVKYSKVRKFQPRSRPNSQSSHSSGESCTCCCHGNQTKVLCDKELMTIAKHLGDKQFQLGIELGLTHEEITTIQTENGKTVIKQGYEILRKWVVRQEKDATFENLSPALRECELDMLRIEQALKERRSN